MKNGRAAQANHANQLNPQHAAYHRARGLSPDAAVQAATEARQVVPSSQQATEEPEVPVNVGSGSKGH